MKQIKRKQIEIAAEQYVSNLCYDESYEYTEAITDIAEMCNYEFRDLFNEDNSHSELLTVIDTVLHSTALKMNMLSVFD